MKTGIYWQDPKYALRPGQDFIFDPSLVLYLPLYQLDGASIMSCDAYGHLCSVTGALWTPRGRSFDGSDDYIDCGSDAILDNLLQVTCELWISCDEYADYRYLVDKYQKHFRIDSTGYIMGIFEAATTSASSTPTSIISKNQWIHIALVYDDTGDRKIHLFVNGEEVSYSTQTAAVGALNNDAARDLYIGNTSWTNYPYDGLIGEVRIYNRALTSLEIQRNYLATKWRYQ